MGHRVGRARSSAAVAGLRSRGRRMRQTELAAKLVQIGVLVAAGLVASRDVERTMHQKPMTHEQQQMLQMWLSERRERK